MSIAQAQQELVKTLAFFDDWMDRYQYLIELGKKLPVYPEEWKVKTYKVEGCQSQVWLRHEVREGKIFLFAMSDAAIVCGLIALLLKVYDQRSPEEILQSPPDFLTQLGFDKHLSPSRSNGFYAMLQRIFVIAKETQIQQAMS